MYSFPKTLITFAKNNSILISITSLSLCSIAYLYQVLELRKWNISAGIVDIISKQYLLTIIIGILYSFSFVGIYVYLARKLSLYIPGYFMYKFFQKQLKVAGKSAIIKDNPEIEMELNNLKQSGKESKRFIVSTILTSIILSVTVFSPFFILFYAIVLQSNTVDIFVLFATTMFLTIASAIVICSNKMKKELKRAKKQIRKSGNSLAVILQVCSQIQKKEIERIKHERDPKKIKEYSAKHLATIVVAVSMFIASMLANLYSSPKKDYWVYTDTNGKQYVSIFETSETTILKQAEINEDEITIFLNKQLVLNLPERRLDHVSFKSVRLDNQTTFTDQSKY